MGLSEEGANSLGVSGWATSWCAWMVFTAKVCCEKRSKVACLALRTRRLLLNSSAQGRRNSRCLDASPLKLCDRSTSCVILLEYPPHAHRTMLLARILDMETAGWRIPDTFVLGHALSPSTDGYTSLDDTVVLWYRSRFGDRCPRPHTAVATWSVLLEE